MVWVEILGNAEAIFPYKYPALFSMTAAIVVIVAASLLDRSQRAIKESAAFDKQYVRSMTGLGADGAVAH